MRFAIWTTVLLAPCLALGCAEQRAEHERQVKELEARVRQLSTKCDRLEERLLAVEAVERYRKGPSATSSTAPGERPELPTVKAGPGETVPDNLPHADRAMDATNDDSQRLMIVGEGTRVEAHESGELRAAAPTGTSNKTTTRAAKRNQGSTPGAGKSSSGANP